MGDEKRVWTIYCHTSPSGKRYVGQTRKTMEQRWNEHVSVSRCPSRRRLYTVFHAAIRKYGPEAFQHEVLAVSGTREEANAVEADWIKRLNTLLPHGYNVDPGAVGYVERGDETRRRMRETQMSKTPEERRDLSLRAAAAQTPEERRQKALKGAAAQTPEQRREKALKAAAAQTPEQRSAKAQKRWDNATPEQRAHHAQKVRESKREAATVRREEKAKLHASPEWQAKIAAEREASRIAAIEKQRTARLEWWAKRTPEQRHTHGLTVAATARANGRVRKPKRKPPLKPRGHIALKAWVTRRRRQREREFSKLVTEIAAQPIATDLGYGC
ncbi:MAG TPA: GIY-YIG nuclease family protein [Gemmatimonadaceae bacterium]|jgi:group I intron endonuclease|nr:GIY-YIG nuclease family protein [Gemmatimonadaceae bacterium]